VSYSREKALNPPSDFLFMCAGDVESSVRAFLAGHGDGRGEGHHFCPPR